MQPCMPAEFLLRPLRFTRTDQVNLLWAKLNARDLLKLTLPRRGSFRTPKGT